VNPTYVSKTLITASSTGLGTISSAGVNTLNSSQIDTQRRIIIWSTGATLASADFTIVGTREGGGSLRETISGPSSNTAVATTQDFLSVTSISVSSVITNQATIGTNSVGSTPWRLIDIFATVINVGVAVISPSALTNYTVEYTYEDPTGTFPTLSSAAGPTPFIMAALNAKTGTLDSNIITPVSAVRLTINSNSTTGAATMVVLQGGV